MRSRRTVAVSLCGASAAAVLAQVRRDDVGVVVVHALVEVVEDVHERRAVADAQRVAVRDHQKVLQQTVLFGGRAVDQRARLFGGIGGVAVIEGGDGFVARGAAVGGAVVVVRGGFVRSGDRWRSARG